MEATLEPWPLQSNLSEALVSQIMKTVHLSRADAIAMALRMLIVEFLLAADMPAIAFGNVQGAA